MVDGSSIRACLLASLQRTLVYGGIELSNGPLRLLVFSNGAAAPGSETDSSKLGSVASFSVEVMAVIWVASGSEASKNTSPCTALRGGGAEAALAEETAALEAPAIVSVLPFVALFSHSLSASPERLFTTST